MASLVAHVIYRDKFVDLRRSRPAKEYVGFMLIEKHVNGSYI